MSNFEAEIHTYYQVLTNGEDNYERTKFSYSDKTFEDWCKCQLAIIQHKLNYLKNTDKKRYKHYRDLFINSQQLTLFKY